MNNNFGNFAVQKVLEYGTKSISQDLFKILKSNIHQLSLQPFGCRVVQTSIEIYRNDPEKIDTILSELRPHIHTYLKDKNANHVLQKCLEFVSYKKLNFIKNKDFHSKLDASLS